MLTGMLEPAEGTATLCGFKLHRALEQADWPREEGQPLVSRYQAIA